MFNEILTGKATLEPDRSVPPAAPPPPPGVEITRTCACGRAFVAWSRSPHEKCGPCNAAPPPAFDEERYVLEAALRAEHSEKNWHIVRWIVIIVIGIILALFRAAAHQTRGEDNERPHGYSSSY